MDMQTLKILMDIQNTAHALHGLLDQLTKQATEYVGDADLASDFVGGVVGILEVEKELETKERKPWRENV